MRDCDPMTTLTISMRMQMQFVPRACCSAHKKRDKTSRSPEIRVYMLRDACLYSEIYCCYDKDSNRFKFSSKSRKRRLRIQSDDGALEM